MPTDLTVPMTTDGPWRRNGWTIWRDWPDKEFHQHIIQIQPVAGSHDEAETLAERVRQLLNSSEPTKS